jgi:heat shock protein HslJ
MPGWAALAALASLIVTWPAGATASSGEWLDQPVLPAWNRAGAKIPRAPRFDPDPFLAKQCAPQARAPASDSDRAVARAGWTLLGASQRFGGTEVVLGRSGVDGMCRPLGYQGFVFSGGRFAGTLAPRPMDSRTDGAAQVPQLWSADAIVVSFLRYGSADPLCCPSRTSTVRYEVEAGAKGPLVKAVDVTTVTTGGTPSPPAPATIALRTWQLVRIQMMDDAVLIPDHPARYTLELGSDGRASVRADCNRGSGSYRLEGRSLAFGPLATTRATCPPGSLSDRYLAQLSQVASWLERDGKLHLAARADGAILEFQPAPGQDGLISPSERCTRSGGTVGSASCCGLAGDFPNTCLVGACGCAPEKSHPVEVCQCPPGQCFDGRSCVPPGKPPTGQLR